MAKMRTKSLPDWLIYLAVATFAGLLFIPFIGGMHLFDWDEINFAESAREMIITGDYLTVRINFQPFWEKPPLFIWMQVLSMKLFGINEFAARFPNAVCGIITLLLLFRKGKKLYGSVFGLLWVLTYTGSLLSFLYFKSGIIDPWFNLFIFTGINYAGRFYQEEKSRGINMALSAFFIGLATLTKGPVALLILLLTVAVYVIIRKFRLKFRWTEVLLFVFVYSITGGFWFILQILKGNYAIIAEFINYQVHLFKTQGAGHGGFLLYHFVVLFFGMFPSSILAIDELFRKNGNVNSHPVYHTFMKILFWVVLILFTIVRTKIVHYSSLCYFPLTYFAAVFLYNLYKSEIKIKRYILWLISLTGSLYVIIVICAPFADKIKLFIIRHIEIADPFAKACLLADAGWKGYEGIPAVILLTGLIILFIYKNRSIFTRFVYFFICSVLFIFLSMVFITPRAERYSQHAAIEFFKAVSHYNAYIETLGYKSYAHLFYGRKMPADKPEAYSKEWLLKENIDKKLYLSLKTDKKHKLLSQYPDLKILYEKNGFVFCVREKQ
jgi:hypothetical protein